MTGNRSRLKNFLQKFIGTVRFRNDHFGVIMGYGDYVIGDSVAFRKHSCYVRDTDGVELIKGSRGSNLYTISVEDMMKSYPICLLSKASKNKSWLWHRRLNHLNFGTINDLARKDLVSKKHTHKPKAENTIMEVLHTLHIDLCGPMRVQTINGKRYILVIMDDFSRFTWVKFLRSKDETPEFVTKFLTQVQVGRYLSPKIYFENSSTKWCCQKTEPYSCGSCSDDAIFSKALIFLWEDAVATACYTQNRSPIHTRYNKTPYELVHDKKPDLTFLRVFGALCYPTNDNEDLGKLQPTADIGILLLSEPMAPVHLGTGPVPYLLMPGQISLGLVPNPVPTTPYVPPTNKELEILFQPMFDEYLEPPLIERPVPPALAVQVPVNSAGTPSSTTIDQDAPSASHSPSSSVLQSLSSHQEPSSKASSFEDFSSAISTHITQPHHHLGIWSKDHPLDNVIAIPLNLYPLGNNLQPMPCGASMQDEIHEFDRLQVCELLPRPDCVMIIALKWIYKVKPDEYDDVLKNKARLVAKGYRQEEGIDFEEL
ncbi:retrovirus-related pol polyprotein from transposon TNT 1-94 [Tanacetum coccineum]